MGIGKDDMFNYNKLGLQTGASIFEKNEELVNQTICKGMAYAFIVFPVMLLLNAAGLFRFSGNVEILLVIMGGFCTLSPLVLSKFVHNPNIIKYYALICIIVLVSVLAAQYHVGIYITLILAPVASCLYFDKKLTIKILLLSWIGYLIAYYFRCIQMRDILYPNETVMETYLPLAAGYTLEFLVSLIFLYHLADRTHTYLLEQKKLIADMEKKEKKIQLAMEAATDILFEYDIKRDYFKSNGSFRDWERKDIEVEHFQEALNRLSWKTQEFPEAVKKISKLPEEEGNHFSGEFCLTFLEEGKEHPIWASVDLNIIRNSDGIPETLLGKMRDITEQKLEEIKMKEAGKYDTLTGMYHYSSLRKIVKESEGRLTGKTHQIMIINIKNYHEIAKSYGEVYRDFVIMNMAEVLKKSIQDEGVFASRLSDNVFLVYIEDCDKVDSRQIRQDLNAGLHNIYVGENEINKLVYDFGYYLGEEDIDALFKVALRYVNTAEALEELQGTVEETREDAELQIFVDEKTFYEYSQAKKSEAANIFLKNIASLLSNAKEQRSAIQMAFAWVGRFFALDGIRIYQFSDSKERVMPEFSWTASEEVEKEWDSLVLEHQVAEFFIENFGHSRVVDNTIGAFQDFFRQFEENPLLLPKYSSLIYPLASEDICKAIILYDMRKTDYMWSDDQKKYLLEISKTLRNVILSCLADSSKSEKHVFLDQISLELRKPISVITDAAEMAKTEIDHPDKMKEYLDDIEGSAQTLVHALDDISDECFDFGTRSSVKCVNRSD